MKAPANQQAVGVQGDKIVVLIPKFVMSKQEALAHAAWLVALADDKDEFSQYLEAVRNT